MRFIHFLAFIFISNSIFSQFNLTLKTHLPYNEQSSSCWGYTDSLGREYAIIGVASGTLFYDITNPTNPIKKGFIQGNNSIWREMKVVGKYCYVTSEAGPAIQIISLKDLPDTVKWSKNYDFSVDGVSTMYRKGHTITNDENGYLYLNGGGNSTKGSPVILNTSPDPENPTPIKKIAGPYCHDSYAKGNKLYASCGYAGVNVYNIDRKDSVYFLQNITLHNGYSHNAWTNNAQTHLFTTEEVPANLPIGSFDISNLNNVKLLDNFWRNETKNQGVIPHNVHVAGDDFIVTAYYTDGVNIIDGKRPDNLIEVAHYDTYLIAQTEYHGAWGVYPYFPSGNLIVSDIEGGLWIFTPNYVHACWLEGNVRDSVSHIPLDSVRVSILHPKVPTRYSNTEGIFKTGIGITGTYEVTFSKDGYYPKSINLSLVNGELTTKTIDLVKIGTATKEYIDNSIEFKYLGGSLSGFSYNLGIELPSTLTIYNTVGMAIKKIALDKGEGYIRFDENLPSGIYLAMLKVSNGKIKIIAFVK